MYRVAIKLIFVAGLSALALLLCSTAFTTQKLVKEAAAAPKNLALIPSDSLVYPIGRGHSYFCGGIPHTTPYLTLLLAHEKIWIHLTIPAEMTGYDHIPPANYLWKISKQGGEYDWDEAASTLDLVRETLAAIDSQVPESNTLALHQQLSIASEDQVEYGDIVAAMNLAVAKEFVDFDIYNTDPFDTSNHFIFDNSTGFPLVEGDGYPEYLQE